VLEVAEAPEDALVFFLLVIADADSISIELV